jgi:hypothetical protein
MFEGRLGTRLETESLLTSERLITVIKHKQGIAGKKCRKILPSVLSSMILNNAPKTE